MQYYEQGWIQIIVPSSLKQKSFCSTEEASEDDYVSHQAEKYHVKVAESNLSADSFEHLRYMVCTNRKTELADLPLTFAAIQGHIL